MNKRCTVMLLVVATLLTGFLSVSFADDMFYYVTIEKGEGGWTVKNFDIAPPTKWAKPQEIIKYSRNSGYLDDPAFVQTDEWHMSNKNYACKVRSDSSVYTPCNSLFTKFMQTAFFGIAGDTIYRLDHASIKQAIDSAGVRKIVDSCINKYADQIEDFKSKVTITPVVVDETGIYRKTPDLRLTIKPNGFTDCFTQNLGSVEFSVSAAPQDANFDIKLEQSKFTVKYNPAGYNFTPAMRVLDRYFKEYNVNHVFSDKNINVKVKKISQDIVEYDLSNLTDKFIKIDTISFYLNGKIITTTGLDKELPPESSSVDTQKVAVTGGAFKDSFERKLNNTNAHKEVSIGVAVKYSVEGISKNLYLTKKIALKNLLAE
jgi:hypothetical protein